MNNYNKELIFNTKNRNKCIKTNLILKINKRKYDTNNLNEFSKFIILPIIFIYKSISFHLFRNTFYYLYYYFKNGIIVHINNNKLKLFNHFNNQYYYNPFIKYLYFNEKDAKQLLRLEKLREKGKIIEFYKLEKQNSEFVNLYNKTYKIRSEIVSERRKWVPDSYFFINSEMVDNNKNHLYLYKFFFEEYVKFTNNNNLLFFLNLRSFPISRKDNCYPLKNIVENYKIPYKINYPILSYFTSYEYNDIPIPVPWDIRYIFNNILFPDINCNFINKNKLQLLWENKINKLCFRGFLTGNGNDADNNIRIKAYEIGLKHKEILDIGIMEFKKQIKKNKNQPLVILKTKYFSNGISDYEQSFYKYLLILEDNFYSHIISYKLNMKSCLLLQESENKMWYSNLLKPYKNYVPIAKDLSNLVKQTKWCLENDHKCKIIAKNGYNLVKKVLTKEYMFNYMHTILNKNCSLKVSKILKIKNKIAIIIIYQKKRENKKLLKSIIKYYEAIHPYIDLFIIEQSNTFNINYGMMKNIGFDLIKNKNYDYFIFSNIFYIPDDELSEYLYNCNSFPMCLGIRGSYNEYIDPKMHMSYYENNKDVELEQNISKIVCFDKKTFVKINGYPNQFWGISGENKILLLRIYEKKLKLYYPDKGRLINLSDKKRIIDNYKKINEYLFNKSLKGDGLYNIKQYYTILYSNENYFKVELEKKIYVNYYDNNKIYNDEIIKKIKKIKCVYI